MIRKIFKSTKDSITNFTSNPINSLGFLIPDCIGLSSLISGIVLYVKFILNGGYVNQINAIKEFGIFDGYDRKFTSGTFGVIYAGVTGKIILALVCIEFVLMMINYFRASSKAKRIVMIVDLVIMGIQIALRAIVFRFVSSNLVIGGETAYEVLKPFEGMSDNSKAILIIYAGFTTVSIIVFWVFILITKECRWMIKYSAIALAVAYIGIPLVFWLLQNVIPLVTGAVAFAIIGGVILFIFKAITGEADEGDSIGSVKLSSGSNRGAGNSTKKRELVIKGNCAYIPDFNRSFGFKLWKIHGGMHDYIASDNGIMQKEICSLDVFEKGKFHIYESESGKEIKSSQIPWMK